MALPPGFNAFLIVIAVVVGVLAAGAALYTVLAYAHPDDSEGGGWAGAWVGRGVAALAFAQAGWTVLLFPLDVANAKACSPGLAAAYCTFAIPSRQLWYACYISNMVMVFAVIPLAFFFYEADSENSAGQRLASAALWTLGTTTVAGAGAAVAYVFGGVADYPVTVLSSGLAGWGGAGAGAAPGSPAAGAAALLGPPAFSPAAGAAPLDACIPPGTLPTAPAFTRGRLCDAVGGATPVTVWAARVGFPTYAVALAGTAGWALFLAFAGVGLVALPADLVRAWAGRPRATIPRSEYARRAAALGARAAAAAAAAGRLRAEERGGVGGGGGGSSGKSLPRAALRTLRLEVDLLEADTAALEAVFPRGEDPAAAWALTVLGFWARLVVGVVSGLMTAAWVVHLALAVFPRPPLSPVLNDALAGLDRAAPLLGTAAFAALCFHLVASTLAGCARVGLALGLGRVHPMVRHGTHASGLLFNGGLALLASGAAVQFTAQAFAPYAGGSVIHEIWGGQILHLRGLKYLYRLNIFMYSLVGVMAATAALLAFQGAAKWVKPAGKAKRGGR